MRISTGMIYNSGLSAMQTRSGTLLTTQQQLSSGRRILRPSDDPVAAARALEVTQSQQVNANQAGTRNNAKDTLGLIDSQLESATGLMARVRELAVQGGNGSLTITDRRSISNELRARFDELLALANSRDGTGQYLFGGYQSNNQPFAGSVDSGVTYGGDDGLRMLRVSASREIAASNSGNDVFMRIMNGNGTFVTSAQYDKPANATHMTYEGASSPPPGGDPAINFELRFWTDPADGTTYYDALNTANGMSLISGTPSVTGAGGTYTNVYTSGTPIDFSGIGLSAAIVLTGTPADGDAFTVDFDGTDLAVTGKTFNATAARATIDAGTVTDPLKWGQAANSGNIELRFWVDAADELGGGAGATYYDLVDTTTGFSLFTGAESATGGAGSYTNAYTSGSPIALASAGPPAFDFGASVTVTGIPAGGDAFSIKADTGYLSNGFFSTAEQTASVVNAGSGVIGTGEVIDAAKWASPFNSRNLEIRFWQDPERTAPNGLYYDLVDKETSKSLFTDTISTTGTGGTFTHSFQPGDSIGFKGLHSAYSADGSAGDFGVTVSISGTPAGGDTFAVAASSSESVFDTMSRLITSLEAGAPVGTTGNTHFANELSRSLANIGQVEENLLRVRASIGSRLAEVEDLDTVGENLDLQYAETLSRLQDLDYSDAITRLNRQQMELQAAQQSFVRVSQLSLFDYLR